MITPTNFKINVALIEQALHDVDTTNPRYSINQPTNRFFYDKWVIKPEFQNTVWQEIYNSLPLADKGEARIIRLDPGACYISHADIDDRYHLNLSGEHCFLVDIDESKMYPVTADGIWYDMDAGPRHSAINFGNKPRYQLVVRKLLKDVELTDPEPIKIYALNIDQGDARHLFDNTVSHWLSYANKRRIINNFNFKNDVVSFNISAKFIPELRGIVPVEFTIE